MPLRRFGPLNALALLGGILGAAGLFGFLNQPVHASVRADAARQVIATVDLRIGSQAAERARGEAQGRADARAGRVTLESFQQSEPDDGLFFCGTSAPYSDGYNVGVRMELQRR